MDAVTMQKGRKAIFLERSLGWYAKAIGSAAVVVTGLTTILGAANALWQYSLKEQAARKEAQIKQLTTFGSFSELVKKDR